MSTISYYYIGTDDADSRASDVALYEEAQSSTPSSFDAFASNDSVGRLSSIDNIYIQSSADTDETGPEVTPIFDFVKPVPIPEISDPMTESFSGPICFLSPDNDDRNSLESRKPCLIKQETIEDSEAGDIRGPLDFLPPDYDLNLSTSEKNNDSEAFGMFGQESIESPSFIGDALLTQTHLIEPGVVEGQNEETHSRLIDDDTEGGFSADSCQLYTKQPGSTWCAITSKYDCRLKFALKLFSNMH